MKFMEKKEQTKKLAIRGVIVVCTAIVLFIAIDLLNVLAFKGKPFIIISETDTKQSSILYDEDDKGKPKYPVNTLATAVNQVADLAEKLMKAERTVAQEIVENSKMRGQKEKSILEDGFKW